MANLALVEGTATALMNEYQRRHFRPEAALGGAAAGALAAPSTASLPPFVTAQLLFPYLDGERFVRRLYATGGGSWRLVDLAERVRPPVSTEQVLHPERYLAAEPPRRVRLRGVGRTLGPSWERLAASTFGEWQPREWLARAGGGAARAAAAGWGIATSSGAPSCRRAAGGPASGRSAGVWCAWWCGASGASPSSSPRTAGWRASSRPPRRPQGSARPPDPR